MNPLVGLVRADDEGKCPPFHRPPGMMD